MGNKNTGFINHLITKDRKIRIQNKGLRQKLEKLFANAFCLI